MTFKMKLLSDVDAEIFKKDCEPLGWEFGKTLNTKTTVLIDPKNNRVVAILGDPREHEGVGEWFMSSLKEGHPEEWANYEKALEGFAENFVGMMRGQLAHGQIKEADRQALAGEITNEEYIERLAGIDREYGKYLGGIVK